MALDLNADRAMLEAAQRDPTAFGAIFVTYFDPIYCYCALRSGSAAAAEDAAMAVFRAARSELPDVQWDNRPLLVWLLALARMHGGGDRSSPPNRAAAETPTASASDGVGEARRLLGRVDSTTASAMVLKFMLGCSTDELARVMDVPPGTAHMHLFRAVSKLRQRMEADDEG
jgi:DNA-directed RNA polymerase specialized sigma24 family protein